MSNVCIDGKSEKLSLGSFYSLQRIIQAECGFDEPKITTSTTIKTIDPPQHSTPIQEPSTELPDFIQPNAQYEVVCNTKEEVMTMKLKIEEHKNYKDELKSTIAELKIEKAELKTENAELKNEIKEFKLKEIMRINASKQQCQNEINLYRKQSEMLEMKWNNILGEIKKKIEISN